jgi:hypothetical protein
MRWCANVGRSPFIFSRWRAAFLLLFLGTSYGPTLRVLDAVLTTLDLSHEFLPSHWFTSFIYINGHILYGQSLILIHDRRRLPVSRSLLRCTGWLVYCVALVAAGILVDDNKVRRGIDSTRVKKPSFFFLNRLQQTTLHSFSVPPPLYFSLFFF